MKNVSVVRRATPFLVILTLAGITLPLAAQSLPPPARSSGQPPRNTAGPGGALGGGGGGGRGFGGAAGSLDDLQQTAVTRLDEGAEGAYEAWRDARRRLLDSIYTQPLNPFTLTQAIDDQAAAELELALTRANGFSAIQASAQRLAANQVATLRQSSANNLPSTAATAPSETVTSAPQSGGVLAVLNPIEGTIGTDEYMARSVTLKDGFKMELLYVVPTSMGSWVPATWDDRGRMIVSAHNSEQIFRLTLPRLGTNDAV